VVPALLAAYQVLQVAPWADFDEVARAYRSKLKQHHPDLQCHDPRRVEQLALLIQARDVVRDSRRS
jgi:curved DNA-binding protein CbpA